MKLLQSTWYLVLIAGLLFALGYTVQAAGKNPFTDPAQQPALMTINGSATITAAPDQASVSLGIRNIGTDAATAMRHNSRQMAEVYEVLNKAGIKREDIATSGLSLQPQYDHSEGRSARIDGYQAENSLIVTIRDIDKAGAVLDAIVGVGINSIGNIRFEMADTSALEAEAREAAARDARAKAHAYAKAIGTDVIGIRMINESGMRGPQPMQESMMMRASSAPAPVPLSQEDVAVTANVSVVFEISGTLK